MAATTPTTTQAVIPQQGGGISNSTLGALADAAAALFDVVNSALQPGIISTRAYFEQLIQAKPSFQNPFAGVNESRKSTNTILIYAGTAVAIMLIIALIVKLRKK